MFASFRNHSDSRRTFQGEANECRGELRVRIASKTITARMYRLPRVFQAVFQGGIPSEDRDAIWQFFRFCVSTRVGGEKISRYYTMIMGTAQ